MGSDTVLGVVAANHYYNESMAAFSVPAAEHSTVTSWGRERETDAYRNMIAKFARPGAIVSVVSDSYDLYAALKVWGTDLKQAVLDSGGTLVIRPDSGDPQTIVLQTLHALEASFGSVLNSKGRRVLNNVRVIQGDGVNPDSLEAILAAMDNAGFAADNIVFGMGGALLQQINRDTQRFAMKCSAIRLGDTWHDVSKDPVTDHQTVDERTPHAVAQPSNGRLPHGDAAARASSERGGSRSRLGRCDDHRIRFGQAAGRRFAVGNPRSRACTRSIAAAHAGPQRQGFDTIRRVAVSGYRWL
jgi:nicotinic acid phosphoribosyltransferase